MEYDIEVVSQLPRIGKRHRIVPVPPPAAGADFSYVFPEPGCVLSAYAKLVTDNGVANRLVSFELQEPNGAVLHKAIDNTAVTASLTAEFSAGVEVATVIQGTAGAQFGLPRLWLPAGAMLSSVTAAIHSGDQWGSIALVVQLHDE